MLRSQGNQRDTEHRQRSLLALADQEEMVSALAMENHLRWALDGIGCAKPNPGSAGRLDRGRAQETLKQCVVPHLGGGVPLEDDRFWLPDHSLIGTLAHLVQPRNTLLFGEPDHLERAVAFD